MRQALDVTLSPGGKHDLMSTHNCVMQAGSERFFELISIDPDAPAAPRKRWFTLDDPTTQQCLQQRPRALCWVVNTDDLDAVVAASPIPLGEIVTFTRGDRSWRLTVPADGHLPEYGLLPAFIEWSPGPHPPCNQIWACGCRRSGCHIRSRIGCETCRPRCRYRRSQRSVKGSRRWRLS